MPTCAQLSPELAEGLSHLSRAVLAATRAWTLHPPDHPSAVDALDRLSGAVHDVAHGVMVSIGVTPATLVIEGVPAAGDDSAVAEAAALLHGRDVLELTFAADISRDAIRSLLTFLSMEAGERHSRGGAAQIWNAVGDPSIHVVALDYRKVLEREGDGSPAGQGDYGSQAERLEDPVIVNTWDSDAGEHPRAVMAAVDPEAIGIGKLQYL